MVISFRKNIDIVKNILWLFVDKILYIALNFIILIKVANFYGKYDFGLYQYAFNINLILSFFIRCIDGNVVKKYLEIDNESNVLFQASILRIFLSILSLVIGLLFLLFLGKDDTFTNIYFLLLINTVLENISFGIMIFFEYKLLSKKFVISSNIGILISVVFQIFAIRNNLPITSVVYSLLIASIAKSIILYYQFFKSNHLKISKFFDKNLIFNLIKESLPISISLTSFLIFMRIDQVMIGNMLSLNEVGVYSLAVQMTQVMTLIIKPIQVSFFPNMVKEFFINKKKYYQKFILITSLSTYLFIFLSVVALNLVPIIFGKFIASQYNESLYIFQFLLIGTFFLYNSILTSNHVVIIKQTKIIMYISIIAAFLNIGLNYLLIPPFFINGAVISTIISQIFASLILNLLFKKSKKLFYLQIKALNPIYLIKAIKLKVKSL